MSYTPKYLLDNKNKYPNELLFLKRLMVYGQHLLGLSIMIML